MDLHLHRVRMLVLLGGRCYSFVIRCSNIHDGFDGNLVTIKEYVNKLGTYPERLHRLQ